MINCQNCGYEYEDHIAKCPFCGAENTELAKHRQEDTLRKLEEEGHYIRRFLSRDIMRSADRRSKSAGKRILLAGLSLFAIAMVSVFTYFAVSGSIVKNNVKNMEQLMAEGKYYELGKALDHAKYNSAYSKFYPVSYAFDQLVYAQDSVDYYLYDLEHRYDDPYFDETLNYDVALAISECLNVHYYADSETNDNLVTGNEAVLLDLAEKADALLTEELMLTPDEVTALKENIDGYCLMDDYAEWAVTVRERIEGK